MRIPLSGPDIGPREIELVNQVLGTPYLSMGPMIERFEHLTAAYTGRRHAIGVSSGTAALHLCMRALELQPGHRVLTSSFSFVSSANCILLERGVPVFVDIDPLTLNMDTTQAYRAAEDLARAGTPAKALLVVQIFGQACDMDPLLDLARIFNLQIIEDACESIGAEYKGRQAGTFGRAATLAYYPNKQMTTGEGGMIVTDDAGWDELFRSLRNQGRDRTSGWLDHVRLGYNYRLDELSAALGVAQMERLPKLLAKRERVARWYDERLARIQGIQPPYVPPYTTRISWFVYAARLDERYDRSSVIAALEERGVPARPYFKPIHLQPFYRELGYQPGSLPITERVSQSTLALPFFGGLEQTQVDYVCEQLRSVLESY
jgi:perosamine synthetase